MPQTPGHDFVGRITGLGADAAARGLAVGQRVAAVTVAGSYATQRNVDAGWLVPVPLVGARLPLRDAAEANRLLENRAVSGKIVPIP